MKDYVIQMLKNQSYTPSWMGVFINPFFLARMSLADNIYKYRENLSNGKLLDVGCGSKPYEKFFNVSEYIGLDIDNPATRKRGQADYFYDGNKFPFGDDEFNNVLCNQVLEHVFNPEQFLLEIQRVLRPGGKLLLTVPFIWDEHEQPFDYGRYSSFGLKSLLEKTGFSVIEQDKINDDASILFQLLNAYLFKITSRWYVLPKYLFTIFVMGPINILGLLSKVILPKNQDMYLDNIVLVEKLQDLIDESI
jgi:Methylase involved in ubiquinone/menaquinone biosynthesis